MDILGEENLTEKQIISIDTLYDDLKMTKFDEEKLKAIEDVKLILHPFLDLLEKNEIEKLAKIYIDLHDTESYPLYRLMDLLKDKDEDLYNSIKLRIEHKFKTNVKNLILIVDKKPYESYEDNIDLLQRMLRDISLKHGNRMPIRFKNKRFENDFKSRNVTTPYLDEKIIYTNNEINDKLLENLHKDINDYLSSSKELDQSSIELMRSWEMD